MRIGYFGTGGFGAPALRAMISSGRAPAVVISSPDRPSGRGLKVKSSEIKQIALQAALPIIQAQDVNLPAVIDHINTYRIELGVVIDFRQKISGELINSIPGGLINLHGSLLPKYRGAAPVNWAIINGEPVTGVTVIQINEYFDAGMTLAQRSVAIDPQETAGELHGRLAELGGELILEVIDGIERDTIEPRPQDPEQASSARKLCKSDGILDFNQPAAVVANLIRGLWPWPAARCEFRSAKSNKTIPVSIARAVHTDQSSGSFQSGCVTDAMIVAASRGTVKILEIKPAGSKLISWQDFVNGRHVAPGDRFFNP